MTCFRLFVCAGLAFAAMASSSASAADVAFVGPSGWSHVDVPAPTDPNRAFAQWHLAGDISTVTFIKDSTTTYPDALEHIHKNFSDNKIKPSIDRDVPCRGTVAHVVEFATGPEGKKVVINRMLVPTGAGISTITYARSDGSEYDLDVRNALAEFCSATP